MVLAVLQKGALSTAEVCEALGLSQLKGRKWHVQRAVAIRGEGLYEGLDWYVSFKLQAQIEHCCSCSHFQPLVFIHSMGR